MELLKELAQLTLIVELDGTLTVPVIEPLFLATRTVLQRTYPDVKNVVMPVDGKFPGLLGATERLVASTYGLLVADNTRPREDRLEITVVPPRVAAAAKALKPPTLAVTVDDEQFAKAVSAAAGEYSAHRALFDKVIDIIADQGKPPSARAGQWAEVVRVLRLRGVTENDPYLDLQTERALSSQLVADDGAAPSSIDIDLPDLEATADIEILKNNVLAMQIFYPSWMLEEARLFDTYDKIEELFLNQMLPLGRGTAGDRIYQRWKKSSQRITKGERLNFYASCFGAPGGNPSMPTLNREFSELWLRFVSAVSEFFRKLSVDDVVRARYPVAVSAEQVRKSGRDVAANLSLHGYGVAYFAATELQAEISEIISVLNDPEVRGAYGARDMWQLIEQVSVYELGGARNTVRYRTMATSGAVIIRWLAQNAARLSGPFQPNILDLDAIRKPSVRARGVRATQEPTDRDSWTRASSGWR